MLKSLGVKGFSFFNLADVFIVAGIMSWAVLEVFIVKIHTKQGAMT